MCFSQAHEGHKSLGLTPDHSKSDSHSPTTIEVRNKATEGKREKEGKGKSTGGVRGQPHVITESRAKWFETQNILMLLQRKCIHKTILKRADMQH